MKANKVAVWYPSSVCVVIITTGTGMDSWSPTRRASTWNEAVNIAKEHGCSAITDVMDRWVVTF